MRIGYRYMRDVKAKDTPVYAWVVGPRNGRKEYLGGFDNLEALKESYSWDGPHKYVGLEVKDRYEN